MRSRFALTVVAAILGVTTMSAARAYDSDWKRGRIYYRQVCTSCHNTEMKKPISPSDRTKAEWGAYLQADKHLKGKDTVTRYFSKQYRDGIKATNAAAAKFADVPDKELLEDVKTFLNKGAKDGDSPASCS